MMIKLRTYGLSILALLQLLMLFSTLLYSWVANLYGMQVQNLLSTDGIRWILRHLMYNFQQMPLALLLLVLMGWGALRYSGWLESLQYIVTRERTNLSPRQRWAFQISWVVLLLYLLILSTGFWGSEPVLLSVTGTLAHSPLMDGSIVVALIGVLLITSTYAWVSGRCTSVFAFLQLLPKGITDGAMLFFNFFLLGQQLGFIHFMLHN